jgi:hypothetical protein
MKNIDLYLAKSQINKKNTDRNDIKKKLLDNSTATFYNQSLNDRKVATKSKSNIKNDQKSLQISLSKSFVAINSKSKAKNI